MSEPEWVGLEDMPYPLADEDWYHQQSQNGAPPEEVERDSWMPQNLASLADTPPVEPTLGGLGLVYPGKRHVFSGPQESAKTLAAYVVGLEVVRQGDRIVLIDFEMGPWDAKGRLVDLGATPQDLEAMLYVAPEVPATPAVIAYLIQQEPALVIVDAAVGAYELQGLDDNKRSDVERFTRIYVKEFWRASIATIVLDHVTKNSETRGNYAIGSERKVGGADVHLGFTVIHPIKRGASGVYKITTHKDRGGFMKRGKLAEFELVSDPDTHALSWAFTTPTESDEEHPFRPTHLMEKVSRFLEMQPEPVPRNTVEKASLGKTDYVRVALDTLTDEGYIVETKGPNRMRLVELERAYREDSDFVQNDTSVRPSSSPQFAPGDPDSGSPVRPAPYRGANRGEADPWRGEPGGEPVEEPWDGIPF